MRFRYAFQKIVDLKENEKRQAEWKLSEALSKLKDEQTSLDELRLRKDDMQHQLIQASSQRTTISELMLLQSFVEHIDAKMEEKRHDLVRAQSAVEQNQEDLNGKALEEKIWNKAKERAFQTFQTQMLKREQEQLDELATSRFRRLS